MKKEYFWLAPMDDKGNPFAVTRIDDGLDEAIRIAKQYVREGDYVVFVWPNRVDSDWGDQPNYSVDYLFKATKENSEWIEEGQSVPNVALRCTRPVKRSQGQRKSRTTGAQVRSITGR